VSLATIIVKADNGRVIHEERVSLAVAEKRAALLAGVSEWRAQPPAERPTLPRMVAVQSAVGRTFD